MTKPKIPSDTKDALHVVCLFLAQSGEPYSELGFETHSDAFEKVGQVFNCPPNNVKNNRDAFDKLTDSKRVGWQTPLRPALKRIHDEFGTCERETLRDLSADILERDWQLKSTNTPLPNFEAEPMNKTVSDFSQDVVDGFQIPKFTLVAESFATTWGFINGAGRTFKLSNDDLATALKEILAAWPKWTSARLNENSINPDETLTVFAKDHFSEGAHKVLANDQRRGFLHFISSVAFTASHNTPFNEQASSIPLEKVDYETALRRVTEIQEKSAKISKIPDQNSDATTSDTTAFKTGGENMIFYGAPGTGKSFAINEVVKTKNHVVRTVFHPDLQNSDFFGGLKPQMRGDELRYDFVPGPFMSALQIAYVHPDEMVYLVIEELNRAAAAAVFGDLFLLLDRDEDGRGEYDVNFPTVESATWFQDKTKAATGKLRLPSNLTIYATMNSADQGVFPLDTAFRRRWRQEYMHLTYGNGPIAPISVIDNDERRHSIPWRKFAKRLNSHLLDQTDLALAEDRLLGQWFVKKSELTKGSLPGKVLLYLWDDLLRHGGRNRIFRDEFKTYGGLSKALSDEKPVFCDAFLEALKLPAPEARVDDTSKD